VKSAVASEAARMLTRLLPKQDRADQPFVVLGDLQRLLAPRLPLSACARSLPREAAVSAVSLPEKKADSTSRQGSRRR
jgi:hypothetical protein